MPLAGCLFFQFDSVPSTHAPIVATEKPGGDEIRHDDDGDDDSLQRCTRHGQHAIDTSKPSA